MKVPISWLKDFVDVTLSVEELAERLTLAGLEVGSIEYVGVEGADLVWDREKLVLAHLLRVEQHAWCWLRLISAQVNRRQW
jgi:phenylalanyl-tRNA synthetase beta chain